ncbi:MAG: hypothetical protein J6W84_06290 [Bacteroidales bacterium]|nr:hypothetical protein [Bacteroidales bacterium]
MKCNLRKALDKANIAYSILESKYQQLNEEYQKTLRHCAELEKELQKLKDLHFQPLMMEVDRILAQKRSEELFTVKS